MWGFHSGWKVIPESRKPWRGESASKPHPNMRVFSEQGLQWKNSEKPKGASELRFQLLPTKEQHEFGV